MTTATLVQTAMTPKLNDQACWQAVLARDENRDGSFFYAVRSTGVYCRPSCPSRRPRRENVTFFVAPQAAEDAGFRPCRRCRPRDGNGKHRRAVLVAEICKHIEQRADDQLTLAALAEEFGMSPFHLQRTFKAVLGITPREYADACRMKSFKQALHQGRSVTEALYNAGYGSSRGLYQRSNAQLGMTPTTYRRGGEGVFIRYSSLDSPIGRMLVAATDKGICSVAFGNSERELLQGLKREFPLATIRQGDVVLRRWISALLAQLHGRPSSEELPLDVQATAFQRRVWEHLRTIPFGSTRSYSQVARAIGLPSAIRAVARACGKNPAAITIPCHRVVHGDGSLGGYRWGIRRKKLLLALEREGGVAPSNQDCSQANVRLS